MLGRVLIVVAMVAILYSLFSAFFFLMRDKGQDRRTVRRLTWRIVLSLLLFLGIMAAMYGGWLQPGSPGPVRYPAEQVPGSGNP